MSMHYCGWKFLAVLVLATGCITNHDGEDKTVQMPQNIGVVKIYSEIDYHQKKSGLNPVRWFTSDNEVDPPIVNGTGFLVNDMIVTAKHVILGQAGLIAGEKSNNRTIRIRISPYSYEPVALWISPSSDLAAIKLKPDAVNALNVKRFNAGRGAQQSEEVSAWGFPDTPSPDLCETSAKGGPLKITAVYNDYLVLNGPIDGGFSGGPVVARSDGALLGVISRSEEKQTRVVRIHRLPTPDDFVEYSDNMKVSPDGQGFMAEQ